MSAYKIIFSGPVGAGKTTALGSISDIKPFKTEETATDETANRKEKTTVAMDYGMLKLDSGERIHLYGTPGQDRFDFMWEILTDRGIGLILLADNKRPDPMADLQFFLEAFEDFIDKTAVVIGITRMDMNPSPSINDYHRWLKENKLNIPVLEIDGREEKDVIQLVQALLYTLDPGIIN
ncbi:MAG: GTP-binding protein [Gammaproteobacteria bacterium]|nr:GTP-binding protein [Gammaproteobacteria bacterium]